jgi:tRNA modification GTPase
MRRNDVDAGDCNRAKNVTSFNSKMSHLFEPDTIAAIATAPGEAGIAIIRVSGPASLSIADRVFQCNGPLPSQRPSQSFAYGHVVDAQEQVVDEAILLIYRAPRSYTREDTIEIQSHGGRVAARRVLQTVLAAGARPAEPGEFTRRAFLNGRIDLLQAEATADLIHAQSDRAATTAIEQLEGDLSHSFNDVYDVLIATAADLEATLDFSEDELPPEVILNIKDRISAGEVRLKQLLATWEEGRLLREGALVVIAGQPNAGKSTLLNALLGINRAIVTEIPGTTRDSIEEQLILDGIPIRLVDTAGLRETECRIEREGVQRAQTLIEQADLVLYVIDGAQGATTADRQILKTLAPEKTLLIVNKQDIGQSALPENLNPFKAVKTCLLNGTGIADIQQNIASLIGTHAVVEQHAAISTRHQHAITQAITYLEDCQEKLANPEHIILSANSLRQATDVIGEITGRIYFDELLDTIFKKFCVGK